MKIYRERWEILNQAIRKVSDGRISIYELDGQFGKPIKEYGINWSACGTQTIEETVKFTELLDMGIDVANTLNVHEVEFPYVDEFDPEIADDEVMNVSAEEFVERMTEVGEIVTEWLRNKQYRKVEKWLLDGARLYEERNA